MHQLLWAGKTLGMALNRLLAIFQVFFFLFVCFPLTFKGTVLKTENLKYLHWRYASLPPASIWGLPQILLGFPGGSE